MSAISLTPALINAVGSAFAEFCGRGTVVIGRDTRPTGPAIEKGLESALVLSGCNVINIGIVPTPTVQVMVEHLQAAGGIVISASHNPIEWNAFKLIGKTGTFLTAVRDREILQPHGRILHLSPVGRDRLGQRTMRAPAMSISVKF